MDIDPAELNKLRQAHIGLTGDLNVMLPALQQPLSIDAWRQRNAELRASMPGAMTIRETLSMPRCC